MNDDLREAFISHMNKEFESFYQYLSIAGHFEHTSWPGLANWMHYQAKEEQGHAMKFYDFLLQRDVFPRLLEIKAPETQWGTVDEIFTKTLDHEKMITSQINDLAKKAHEAGDFASLNFLNWFIEEQLEEEATVGEILERINRVKDDMKGLMLIDAELGERNTAELD